VSECGKKISARKDVVVCVCGGRKTKIKIRGNVASELCARKGRRNRAPRLLSPKNHSKTPRARLRVHTIFFSTSRDARLIQSRPSFGLFFFSTTNRPPRKGIKDERNAREAIDRASRRANDRKNGRNAYLDHFRELFYILRSFCAYNKS